MKRFIFILTFLFSLTALLSAQNYEELAKSGKASEIKKALSKDERISRSVFGDNNENFLMLALKNNRELKVIKYCLAVEIDVTQEAKDGRTSVMYACRYSTDPDVVEKVVKAGTMFSIGTAKRLAKKDSSGKNSYDYAKENENPKIYELINKIEKDPAVVAAEKEAKKKAEEQQEQEAQPEESIPESEGQNQKEEAGIAGNLASVLEEKPAAREAEPVKKDKPSLKEEVFPELKPASSEKTSVRPAPLTPIELILEEEAPGPAVPRTKELILPPKPQPAAEPEKKNFEYKTYSSTYLYDYAIKQDFPLQETQTAGKKIDNPDEADKNGVTLLMKAARAGNDWDVQNLLKSGANVNLRDKDGWSALMYAVRYQNSLSLVDSLIEHGAHIRVRNKYNATPLLLASDYSQNPLIIQRLLKNRNSGEDEVFRAFVLAVTSNQGEAHVKEAKIRLFIDMDIPINRLWKGKTPLMYAAQYASSTETIKVLLDNGAKPGIRDSEGKTAFDYAKINSNLKRDDVYWSLNSSER